LPEPEVRRFEPHGWAEGIRRIPQGIPDEGDRVNRDGHPRTLQASHPENRNNLRHGVYSADKAALEPRAREIAEGILAAPHTIDLDELGAVEIGRLEALIEAIDQDLAERGLTNKRGDVRSLVDLRLRASRRLAEWLDRYGLNPHARADWAAKLGRPSFMEQVEQRRREMETSQAGEAPA
jgi:hypothetical protein